MAAQPGLPGSQFPGEDSLVRRVQELEKAMQQFAAANVLATAGIGVVPNGITVNGSASFTGDVVIGGTLSLPAGIIDNAALTDPVVLSTAGLSQNNFNVPTTDSVYAQATVAIPAGYTRADVICMVVAGAANGSASADFLYVSSSINGVLGGETPQVANSGNYASAAANGIRSLTGLSGGNITVGCNVRAGTASWGTNAANFANTNAFIYFRR